MTDDNDQKLSCYLLTYNSGRYLAEILKRIGPVVDDLLLVDSGSSDNTEEIAKVYQARLVGRAFDNFRDQRTFAIEECRNRWVLCLDSDEVPDEELVAAIARLKSNRFQIENETVDAFRIKRRWFVLGREIHAFYPIVSPDYPVRLFRKDRVGFDLEQRTVHETISGHESLADLDGCLKHYSCDSIEELYGKLNQYTSLAADDLKAKGGRGGSLSGLIHALAAWSKWYITRGGWRDGRVGLQLAKYAFDYTYLKYRKRSQLG